MALEVAKFGTKELPGGIIWYIIDLRKILGVTNIFLKIEILLYYYRLIDKFKYVLENRILNWLGFDIKPVIIITMLTDRFICLVVFHRIKKIATF